MSTIIICDLQTLKIKKKINGPYSPWSVMISLILVTTRKTNTAFQPGCGQQWHIMHCTTCICKGHWTTGMINLKYSNFTTEKMLDMELAQNLGFKYKANQTTWKAVHRTPHNPDRLMVKITTRWPGFTISVLKDCMVFGGPLKSITTFSRSVPIIFHESLAWCTIIVTYKVDAIWKGVSNCLCLKQF